jgi:hypothetical protein
MSRTIGRLAVTVATGLALIVIAMPLRAGAASGGQRVFYAQGFSSSQPAYRPHKLIASANGSFFIRHMHWSSWTRSSAKGHGTAWADNCKPDCASGHYRKDPVHVRLLKPRNACGKRYFVSMRLHYTGKKFPSNINRHQHYDTQPNCVTSAARPAAKAVR